MQLLIVYFLYSPPNREKTTLSSMTYIMLLVLITGFLLGNLTKQAQTTITKEHICAGNFIVVCVIDRCTHVEQTTLDVRNATFLPTKTNYSFFTSSSSHLRYGQHKYYDESW